MSGATEHADGSRKRWKHGATIGKDGEVRLTSVSALELAASCLRRWKSRYGPLKLQEPPTKSTDHGNKCHADMAKYLTTGSRAHLPQVIIAGLHQVPTPGPDLYVEYDFVPDLSDGRSGLEHAILRADDIPVTGAIDLLHERPENYGVPDIMDTRDEPGVIKMVDWKFPGNTKNIKTGHEIVEGFQMAGYGKWGFLRFPHLERIRLSLCYFPGYGTPRHSTALVTRDQVEQTWKHADAVAVSMKHAAREPDLNKIEFNTDACHRYGKPCPALEAGVCDGPKQDTFAEYVGITAEERLITAAQLVRPRGDQQMTQPTQPVPNNIMAHYQQQGAPAPMQLQPQSNTYPAPAQPQYATQPYQYPTTVPQQPQYQTAPPPAFFAPTTQPYPPGVPVPVPPAAPPPPAQPAPDPQSVVQQTATNAAIMSAPAPSFDVLALIQEIESYGMGFPTLSGLAAGHVGRLTNRVPVPRGVDHYLDGHGEPLGRYVIAHIEQLPGVLANVKIAAAQRQGAPMPAQAPANNAVPSALPPDAPMSNPATASIQPGPSTEEIEAQKKAQKEAEKAEKKAKKEAEKAAKKAAEEAAKQAAAQAQSQMPAAAPAPAPAPDPYLAGIMQTQASGGSMPTVVNVMNVAPADAPQMTPPTFIVGPANGVINCYVDCAVDGVQLTSLHPVVEHLKRVMTQESGDRDFRVVTNEESKFAFGRWEGMFEWMFKSVGLPGGNYNYDGAYGRIGSIVVEVMRELCRSTGGVFVKGAR